LSKIRGHEEGFMHLSLASPRGGPWGICGGIGDFVGTLQQIGTAVVGEMWGTWIYDAPTLRENIMWGLCF